MLNEAGLYYGSAEWKRAVKSAKIAYDRIMG
jgi:hypothetical protein